jgi:signal transduction histidine kinase
MRETSMSGEDIPCHDIVKGHGGMITAENGSEGGAVFTITLPLN